MERCVSSIDVRPVPDPLLMPAEIGGAAREVSEGLYEAQMERGSDSAALWNVQMQSDLVDVRNSVGVSVIR